MQSMPAKTDPVLDVAGLSVVFETDDGPLHAVDGLSFSLRAGRTTALVGESGCGKSMTALALLGLVPPPGRIASGSVRFGDQELTGLDEPALRRVRGCGLSMVFQEPTTALNPVYPVGDQVAEAYRLHHDVSRRQAWAEAVAMLGKVGIPDPEKRARAYPHQLSGGMRQRAMIAMALICRPSVLLADEPTTALDVTVQAQILDLMLTMQGQLDTAMLFISHDLAVVSAVAAQLLVMYAGRLVEQGTVAELLAHPRHPYTQGLIATLPGSHPPGSRLPAIAGTVPDLGRLPPGCRFSDRCPLADDGCRAQDPPLEGGVACWKAER